MHAVQRCGIDKMNWDIKQEPYPEQCKGGLSTSMREAAWRSTVGAKELPPLASPINLRVLPKNDELG